ncbi:protein phosphatase 2C domain-containing protein [Ornithinimicrobium sufpigmenti]|uniref:protein phosphatase 2C domain-containing protein n=1 Tax=Ornithinimicrobium sufpigmenti TaxID=2508882 RepID=UPI0010363D8A|nr:MULTISPECIES: protein phosphatase 2C domain-containing protein [unclassified Ornithinimicrobium]
MPTAQPAEPSQPTPDGAPAEPTVEPATEPTSEPTAGAEEEIIPLTPPDPPEAHPDPDPFSGGPPPLPEPMLVLDGTLPEQPEQSEEPEPVDHGTCASCGGAYDEDGWCTQCGERRPDPRDHFSDRPAPHVAAVCDRGRRHTQNQDAMAVRAAEDEPGRAVLVVCDGVSSAERSAEASLAAAEAAVEVLSRTGAPPTTRLVQAADAAVDAIEEVAREFPGTAPSCTFVAGIVDGGTLTVGSVGDSRAYWFPDEGEPVRLTSDDSMAEEQVRAGMGRAEAEASAMAHTITRWLGPDAPDHTPQVRTQDVSAPGWALLCSDGLWNYASEPHDLAAVLRQGMQRAGSDPLELARALVDWANEQGGADNITVALARTGSTGQDGSHG